MRVIILLFPSVNPPFSKEMCLGNPEFGWKVSKERLIIVPSRNGT